MEKPILFSTEMVKAILEDRKTQTRRVVRLPETKFGHYEYCKEVGIETDPLVCINGNLDDERTLKGTYAYFTHTEFENKDTYIKLHYQIGDILWVRETWNKIDDDCGVNYLYKATDNMDSEDNEGNVYKFKWKPSIHMPKSAARIWR